MINPKIEEEWDIIFALQEKGCGYSATYEAQVWDPRLCGGPLDNVQWVLISPCPEGCTSSPPPGIPTNPPPCDPDYDGVPIASLVACCEGMVQIECTGTCCQCGGVTCEPSETCCDNVCVDLTTDHDHCGGCNIVCEPSEKCCPCLPEQCNTVINWTWIPSPECPATPENPYPLGGEWITSDNCPAGCSGKVIPSPPMDVCGPSNTIQQQCVCSIGTCTDVTSDENNCGDCGFSCDIGFTCCSGVCKELFSNDPLNCGACGKNCLVGEVCVNGVCKPACSIHECSWTWNDIVVDPCTDTDCGVQNWKWTYGTSLTGNNIFSGGSWALVSDCNADGVDFICTGTNTPPAEPNLGSCNGAFDAYFNWLCNDPFKVPGVDCQNSGPHEISGTGSCFDVDCNCEPAPPDCTSMCIWFCSFQPPHNGWFLSSGCESGCQCDEPSGLCVQGGQLENSEEDTVCYQPPAIRALAGSWEQTSFCQQGCICPESAPVQDGTFDGQIVSYECVDCLPCQNGQTCCNNACKNLSNDPNNCGSCGNQCPIGQSCCSGSCIDLSSDSLNCGSCGNQCPIGQTCYKGICQVCNPPCEPPLECCEGVGLATGYCVDKSSDNYNCGECGLVCPSGYSCVNSSCLPCEPPCLEQGTKCCSNQCIDIWYDENNCGDCGYMCAPGLKCCGFSVNVGGGCKNTQDDMYNCGDCGIECPQIVNQINLWKCCDGVCRNLKTDPYNCGECGLVCPEPPGDTFTVPKCFLGHCAEPLCECQGYEAGMPPQPGPHDVAFVASCVGNTVSCDGPCYFDAVDGVWIVHEEDGSAFYGTCGHEPDYTYCADDRISCVDDKLACVGDIYYCVQDIE